MAPKDKTPAEALLARAHSPSSVARIYEEKIKYRPLILRPSSPLPKALDAREARRKARKAAKVKKKLKPKPLSARERRRLGLYEIPKEGQKYALFEPLHKLWLGYMREILGNDIYKGGFECGQKLVGAEMTGADMEVVRSGCVSRVGVRGLVIKDSRHVFELITRKNHTKTIPKEGTVFRVTIPVDEAPADGQKMVAGGDNDGMIPNGEGDIQMSDSCVALKTARLPRNAFVFDIHGDQFMYRPADRANRKWRVHFNKKL